MKYAFVGIIQILKDEPKQPPTNCIYKGPSVCFYLNFHNKTTLITAKCVMSNNYI